MLLASVLFATLPLVALVSSSSLSSRSELYDDFSTKHSWGTSIPSLLWNYHSTPDPSTLLSLRIGLRPSNFDALLGHLTETSDPFHERYGKHLTKAQVDELMRPTKETLEEVREWLKWHGVEEDATTVTTDQSITLNIPVSLAETLLNTKYHMYMHAESEEKIIRTLEYSLPRHLHDHINLVSPTTYFGTTRTNKLTSFLQPGRPSVSLGSFSSDVKPQSSCETTITPSCLKDLYNVRVFLVSTIPLFL